MLEKIYKTDFGSYLKEISPVLIMVIILIILLVVLFEVFSRIGRAMRGSSTTITSASVEAYGSRINKGQSPSVPESSCTGQTSAYSPLAYDTQILINEQSEQIKTLSYNLELLIEENRKLCNKVNFLQDENYRLRERLGV